MRSASELEASCTKMLGQSCVPSCMKDTGAPDSKGAGCCKLSNIMMCDVNELAISLRAFVFELVVFLKFYF